MSAKYHRAGAERMRGARGVAPRASTAHLLSEDEPREEHGHPWVERGDHDRGQCTRFPAGRPHRYTNDGTTPVRLTMVVVIPPTQT